MASKSFLLLFRKTHLYFGLFISPALLFFAFTGAYQTLGLHESGGTTYKPPAWMATLAQIHKKQTAAMPVRRGGPGPEGPGPDRARRSSSGPDGSPPDAGRSGAGPRDRANGNATPAASAPSAPVTLASKQKQHLPLKLFFVLVSVGLLVSTLTGIYMAYVYDRNKILVTALLLSGVVIPLLLLRF